MSAPSSQALARGWESQHREYSYWVPEADISGTLPPELHGTFFRNGPGLNQVYGKKLAHPIDGDGMICAVTFTNGRVHFKNKFVQTWQHQKEHYERQFLFQGQMGTREKGFLATLQRIKAQAGSAVTGSGMKVVPEFRDPSNTNAFYWGGKLLSCFETHLPHSIDPYTLDTLGPDDLNGTLQYNAFAAHARFDPINNRLVTLSLKPEMPGKKPPILQMNEYDENWKLVQTKVLHIPGLNYAHDFALTSNYYIVHKTPFVKMSMLLFLQIAVGLTSPGESMRYFSDLPSEFVLIPRSLGNDAHRLFSTSPFHIYHFGTAMEQDDKIEFNAVCLGTKFNMQYDKELWLANATVEPGNLHAFTLHLKTGKIDEKKVDNRNQEFPVIHPYRNGLDCRYTYTMSSETAETPLPYNCVLKYDSQGKKTVCWKSHGALGEPCFVPRPGGKEEDDGWVIVQVYVPAKHRTDFVVLDASNMTVLAIIKLQHHIPYGFHGTFTPTTFVEPPKLVAKL